MSPYDIEEDSYYQPGDYIGKLGVEKSYEKQLRGEKGVQILLRDARGRIQGKYMDGKYDRKPIAGKDLTLAIDEKLQALGERLMEGKIGSIVALDPRTGEVLCMVSAPSYDPRIMVGRARAKNHRALAKDAWKPLLNRSIMGMYPPGSTFKTSQALTYMTEGIITPSTAFPCNHGFYYRGLHVGCHSHAAPIALVDAISTSCNSYFCWGLYYMIGNRSKYKTPYNAMNTWRDYMVSMGFGYKLGIDLPGEKRGMIPNADYYDRNYRLYIYRPGRGDAHSATDSQPRCHHRQPRLLLPTTRGAQGARRTARHHVHPPPLHNGITPSLRLRGSRYALLSHEGYV